MKKERFFVYILQSMKDFSFYVGQCDDLDCRISKHNEGMSKYSAEKGPGDWFILRCMTAEAKP